MEVIPNYSRDTHEFFVAEILLWHKENELNFIWRRYTSPFKILVTEILLRKTNAEKVQNHFESIINQIGSFPALKNIQEQELSTLLEPLGMQHRKASEMKKLVEALDEEYGGEVPDSKEELLSLPGVGRYIANAVLAAAFSKQKAVVDTNVIRIYRRFFGLESSRSRPRDDPFLWAFADSMLPNDRAVEFNYALIDFAKQVCMARSPYCEKCPLEKNCFYRKSLDRT